MDGSRKTDCLLETCVHLVTLQNVKVGGGSTVLTSKIGVRGGQERFTPPILIPNMLRSPPDY